MLFPIHPIVLFLLLFLLFFDIEAFFPFFFFCDSRKEKGFSVRILTGLMIFLTSKGRIMDYTVYQNLLF